MEIGCIGNLKQKITSNKKGRTMKLKSLNAGIAVCVLAFSLSGCSKSETPPTPPSESQKPAPAAATEAPPAASAPAAEVKPADVKPAVETPAAPAAPAVEPATTTAVPAADTVAAQAQALIDKAKALVDAKQYQPALDIINQLGTMTLSAEQQKLVDDLKTQIQNLMSSQTVSNATSAVGGLLGK
jgi:hypothetical protein